MSYETGTATNYLDLLSKLKTFVTTALPVIERWTVNKDVTANGEREVYFKAPGLAGTDNIYLNIRAYEDSGADLYNWELQGAVAFDTNEDWAGQPNANPRTSSASNYYAPYFTLWNSTITYWFIGDGRRLIVVAKVGTSFFAMHMGFILPYATPTEFPYPLLVGGNCNWGAYNYSVTSDHMNNFYQAAGRGCYFRDVSGNWLDAGHYYYNGTFDPRAVVFFPFYGSHHTNSFITSLRSHPDGSYTLLPCIAHSDPSAAIPEINRLTYGEISNLFFVTGFAQASEDTITINAKTYLVFKNCERVNNNEYAALLLE